MARLGLGPDRALHDLDDFFASREADPDARIFPPTMQAIEHLENVL
jgi:hypothetical protein